MSDLADTTVRDVTLTKNTKIPLYNLWTLLGIAIGGTLWAARMDSRVSNIESAVNRLVDES